MKLWIDDKPPPDDTWTRIVTDADVTTIREALRLGRVSEVRLGGLIGLGYAGWFELWAWAKAVPALRWSVRDGSPLVEGNAKAAMERAEVYWGIREFQPETRDARR